jgi:dipeptidase E
MLRIVLYSDQLLPENRTIDYALCQLIGKPNARIGYISSSSDPTRRFFIPKQQYYQQYGLDLCLYAELDSAFDAELVDQLFSCDAIHLSGGNTFYFLYWLRQRGLVARLRHYAQHSGVLIGISAGAILMTPSIETTLICGDTPYPPLTDYTGFGLTDFAFVPHIVDTPEQSEQLQFYANTYQRRVYGCHDGDGIIVNDTQIQCFGALQLYYPNT